MEIRSVPNPANFPDPALGGFRSEIITQTGSETFCHYRDFLIIKAFP
jgi:hypothetical protein